MRFKRGHTHHGSSQPGPFDLMIACERMTTVVQIHNGAHCAADGPCKWEDCADYTEGDRFLEEVTTAEAVEVEEKI